MTYKTLSYGSNGDDVKKLQQALGIEADGNYGPATRAAVTNYQKQNGLNPDGIAGNITQTKLYGSSGVKQQPVQTPAPAQAPVYNTAYDSQLDELYQKIVGRDKFSYDAASDPLYRQYASMYAQQGKTAMMDTMGQAAGLTGGYGSSYAQAVGQQQYDAYMQKLGDVMPTLYGMARDEYDAEGNNLMQQYSMLSDRRDNEYSRYENELSRYNSDRDTAYERLVSLISTTGYDPTDSELVAGGMTRAQAQAYKTAYNNSLKKSSSGGKSVKTKADEYKVTGNKKDGYYAENKGTGRATYQPDEDFASLLAALYNGEITPSEYAELLKLKTDAEGTSIAR